jgi:DNA-binding response OmpR family regulator
VVGHGPLLEREDGAALTLRQHGATVRTLDLWDDPVNLIDEEDDELQIRPRALVFEALDRPDLAVAALRAVRKEPYFDNVGALIAVTVGQIARIEPSSGFDDFVLHPYVPEELYGRIRALEWRRSEFATEERHKVAGIVVDKAGHLLARVWGNRYEGGPRTVDIHVRRLRAKLGDALPLDTLRGSGYKLRSPEGEDHRE